MQKIKVVIIDQSISVCKKIKNIVAQHENIDVVGISTEIDEGTEIILSTSPHVVLLDVNMPTQNKKTALEIILETKSLPVIILSANTVKQTAKTVQAMSNGAVDFIKKQNGKYQPNKTRYEQEIIAKIRNANKVIRVRPLPEKNQDLLPRKNSKADEKQLKVERRVNNTKKTPIIAIGTSTGGPRALQRILETIPKDFSVPILIVQHMPARFTRSLATRLNNIGNIRVKEAKHGEVIKRGTAYIAPGNYHMKVKQHANDLKVELNQEDEYFGHRPSVNVLFESIATIENIHKIAVILTGMGKDGAEGAVKIKQLENEAIIIAESKETAVIDGMPSAVIATNCVTEIIRLDEIAQALVDYSK